MRNDMLVDGILVASCVALLVGILFTWMEFAGYGALP